MSQIETLRDYDTEDLIVGMVGGTLVPIVGIILGAKLLMHGDNRGFFPLIWCLLLAVPWTIVAVAVLTAV